MSVAQGHRDISGCQRPLVIDAVDVGKEPGTLIRIEGNALETLPGKPSFHQLGFADLMIALKLLGESPEEVVVLGVQPQSTEWSAELTATVRETLDELLAVAIVQLESWGTLPALK
ncbi:MAG: hydrogenase maturation protease [Acidobacteriota bacterium]|nr:hydrogenase maturation protease [Acidobacteriota bacterium]